MIAVFASLEIKFIYFTSARLYLPRLGSLRNFLLLRAKDFHHAFVRLDERAADKIYAVRDRREYGLQALSDRLWLAG